jgi:hypothetical protein
MTGHHHHRHRSHASAAAPTLSLLRLSAAQRLAGSGIVLLGLWLLVYAVLA